MLLSFHSFSPQRGCGWVLEEGAVKNFMELSRATLDWTHYRNILAVAIRLCLISVSKCTPWRWWLSKMSVAMRTIIAFSSDSRPVLQQFWDWLC